MLILVPWKPVVIAWSLWAHRAQSWFGSAFIASFVIGSAVCLNAIRMVLCHREGILSVIAPI